MKPMRSLVPVLCAVLLSAGCRTQTKSTAASPAAATTAGIPARPEALKFPPLAYEPPNPADYRVKLKTGPIAYLVPDHELPLVNLVIYVRTGDYVEPPGQEGLAETTGYLLARGGTQSRTAEEQEERLAFLAANLNSASATRKARFPSISSPRTSMKASPSCAKCSPPRGFRKTSSPCANSNCCRS